MTLIRERFNFQVHWLEVMSVMGVEESLDIVQQ